MNKYGRLAQRHWQRWLPTRYAQIQDLESFFTGLGDQIEDQVTQMAEASVRAEPEATDYLARVGQLNMARLAAEEAAMAQLAYLPPEPQTEGDQQDDQQDPPSRPGVDFQGMPTDRSHPLWEAEHDPEISPEAYRAMLRQWHQSRGQATTM